MPKQKAKLVCFLLQTVRRSDTMMNIIIYCMRDQKGMSFLELGIVILLICVLIIGAVFMFGSQTAQARDASRVEKARKIEKLLLDVFITDGKYPDQNAFQEILTQNKLTESQAGEEKCFDGESFSRDCAYIYKVGNRGFDFLLVVGFESKKFSKDLYETFEWEGQEYVGHIKSTKKLDL